MKLNSSLLHYDFLPKEKSVEKDKSDLLMEKLDKHYLSKVMKVSITMISHVDSTYP